MSAAVVQADPMVALSAAHAALDELAGLDLTGLGEDALLGCWRELERLRRRIPAVEHGLVLEAEGRGLPEAHQLRGVGSCCAGCCASIRPRRQAGSMPRMRQAPGAG